MWGARAMAAAAAAAAATSRAMLATTSASGPCGFSLTFNRWGTSIWGAPYGAIPASSGRMGRALRGAVVGGFTPLIVVRGPGGGAWCP